MRLDKPKAEFLACNTSARHYFFMASLCSIFDLRRNDVLPRIFVDENPEETPSIAVITWHIRSLYLASMALI